MTDTRVALARLRAAGTLSAEVPLDDLPAAVAATGRRLRRVGNTWRCGWDDMHEPDPDGPAVAGLTGFAAAVLAAAIAHAWPDPATDLWPGQPLPADIVDRIARTYERDRKIIQKFLTMLTDVGLFAVGDDGLLHLGAPLATLTPRTVTTLRHEHQRLTDLRGGTR